jgi:hypothetical protein
MGQPLPLPEQIPRPDVESEEGKKLMEALNKAGIVLGKGAHYAEYTMPRGWRMIDDSECEELPIFHMVDEKNMIHFSITGRWEETRTFVSHQIRLSHVNPPQQHKEKTVSLSEEDGGSSIEPKVERQKP